MVWSQSRKNSSCRWSTTEKCSFSLLRPCQMAKTCHLSRSCTILSWLRKSFWRSHLTESWSSSASITTLCSIGNFNFRSKSSWTSTWANSQCQRCLLATQIKSWERAAWKANESKQRSSLRTWLIFSLSCTTRICSCLFTAISLREDSYRKLTKTLSLKSK